MLLVAVVAAAFYFFFRSFKDHHDGGAGDVLNAVPQSAAAVFETTEGMEIPRRLSADNAIYAELKTTDLFFRMDALLGSLDSAIARTLELREISGRGKASLSVHDMGGGTHDYLLVFTVTQDHGQDRVAAAMRALFRPAEAPSTRQYDGLTVYQCRPRFFDQNVHYYIHDGLVGVSFSPVLIEESIRALLQAGSVMEDPDFRTVRNTRSRNAKGELYVKYDNLARVLRPFVSSEGSRAGFFGRDFAKWSALDFNTKSNAVRLNGFVLAADSSDAWLNTFRNSKPVSVDLANYMPSNTAYFVFYGFGDYAGYRARADELLRRSNRSYSVAQRKSRYEEMCRCDMEEYATGWIGSQAAMFIVEPMSSAYDQNRIAAFKALDGSDAMARLRELQSKLQEVSGQAGEELEYRDHPIFRLDVGEYYGDLFAGTFSGLENPYVVRVDDVIFMAQSPNSLRVLINAIDARRTLAGDRSFRDLASELSSQTNFMIYSSLSRSPSIYENILAAEHAKTLGSHKPLLRKFQAFVYQANYHKGDLYYNQAFLRYHPGYSPETNALWEARLNAPVAYPPTFFTNHYTGNFDIVVQDSTGRLYMLNNEGSVLWDRKLSDAIRGDVHRVDVFKNDKYQMLFSTDEHLYLIDRLGRDVSGFPVKLPARATAPVAVADYDRSRDYRFFIPVEGGGILCFDNRGERVKGWEYEPRAQVKTRIRHIRIGRKDYLFALTDRGKVLLLDRRGSPRHEVEATAENFMNRRGTDEGRVSIQEGEDISSSALLYCDSLGSAYRLVFDGRLEKLPLTTDPILEYDVQGEEGEQPGGVVILSDSRLYYFDTGANPVFETRLEGKGYAYAKLFDLQETAVGVTRPDGDRIFLYDDRGNLRPGFPLFGATEFDVGDMDGDGYYNLVVAGRDGFVYAYTIE